jgi:hypothetical protein
MAAVINSPPNNSRLVEGTQDPLFRGEPTSQFSEWFMQVFRICFSQAQSGTTAQRPTKLLWTGRRYFDTSLGANGKPIWVNKTATGWVDAAGNTV